MNPAPVILVVEDDKIVLEIFSAMIPAKFPGVTVLLAENGRMGIDIFKEHSPDIVITDIKMPVMDGIQMAGEIMALKADAKIIAVTAYSDDQSYLEKIGKIGFIECLPKPIAFGNLFAVIERCLDEITPKK